MNYDEMYSNCVDNWKLTRTDKKEIEGLCCEVEEFEGKTSNLIFFSVNGIIIAVSSDYGENISVFGYEI